MEGAGTHSGEALRRQPMRLVLYILAVPFILYSLLWFQSYCNFDSLLETAPNKAGKWI